MTRKQKEKLSNRLVLNFGILLAAGLVLLYVNSAFQSYRLANSLYSIIQIVGIIALVLGAYVFIVGKLKKPVIKNYSAIFFGISIGCGILYTSKFRLIPGIQSSNAVIPVYVAMAVYFIVLAIITGIQLKKPLVKTENEKIKHKKKK
ncbi:MAG: hypothetical protein E7403_03275 [Ruminococcaceae bacterium]|nr:hypothetical protein [Oscillospiraceae bacterium]